MTTDAAAMDNYRHILCATALSEDSRQACARAAALSICSGGRLTLLHVIENFPQDASVKVIPPEDVDPRRFREQHARGQLADLARQTGCGQATLRVCFSSGPAWQAILREARDNEVDLIVLGSPVHEDSVIFADSTREALSEQQPCDILTVKRTVKAPAVV